MKTVESVKLGVVNPLGDFLLLRRVVKNNGTPEIRGGKWDLPGGEIDPVDGRDILRAAERELYQESGLDLGSMDILSVKGPDIRQSKYGHTNIRHLVIARCALVSPTVQFINYPGTEPEHSDSLWTSPMHAYNIIDHPVQREFIQIAAQAINNTYDVQLIG